MNIHDPILGFASLGPTEMLIIFMLILLLFGAKRLPTLARSIGKSLGEFRKAKDEFHEEIVRGEDEGVKSYEKKQSAPPKPRPKQIGTDAVKTVESAEKEPETTTSSSDDSKTA